MSMELFGSYLIFLLVAMLYKTPSMQRKRVLAVIFVALLCPSETQRTGMSVSVETKSLGPDVVEVSMDPVSHVTLLETMDVRLAMDFDQGADWWEPAMTPSIVAQNDDGDDPAAAKKSDDNTQGKSENLDGPKKYTNGQLFETLRDSTTQQQTLHVSRQWGTSTNFLWYASFVAGMWLGEHHLRSSTPCLKTSRTGLLLLLAVSFLCATYPYGNILSLKRTIWSIMNKLAGTLGMGSSIPFFYYVIGAPLLVHVLLSTDVSKRFFRNPMLLWLGRISYSLYLTHVPILYSLTCMLFLSFSTTWTYSQASWMALLISFPVMLTIATLFEQWVDTPAIRWSSMIGRWIVM
mmetsp:Transcript_43916/g.65136  ORF Transcript_43916/g.65136 Transcript_43916/m.65136 type:complete len:348 (-) Transcript_43916:138-1181(-)